MVVSILINLSATTKVIASEILVQPNFHSSLVIYADHILMRLKWSKKRVEGIIASRRGIKDIKSLFEGKFS